MVKGTSLAACLATFDASWFFCNEARLSFKRFSDFAFSLASMSLSYVPLYDLPSSFDWIPFKDLTALDAWFTLSNSLLIDAIDSEPKYLKL
jgi:hypothetical protein